MAQATDPGVARFVVDIGLLLKIPSVQCFWMVNDPSCSTTTLSAGYRRMTTAVPCNSFNAATIGAAHYLKV